MKASRRMLYLPILILYLLIPLLNIADIQSNGEQSIEAISKTVQQYLPLISIWWPVLVFRQFIETNGNELLWIHRNRFDSLLMRSIVLWLAYCIFLIPLFVSYIIILHNALGLFLAVLCQALLFISLAYILTLITKNTLFPILMCFLLILFYLILWRFPLPSIQFNQVAFIDMRFWIRFITEIGIAVCFFGIGFIIEKKRRFF